MDEQYRSKLVESFPLLFKQCKYFECQDGWVWLIEELAESLEPLITEHIEQFGDDMFIPCAAQVKEKFGTLRFYMHSATDEMYELIELAEMASAHICEICGEGGSLNDGPWYQTLCDQCKKEKPCK